MVSIVICYQIGTADMLKVCLSSIRRHTSDVDHRIVIAYKLDDDGFDAKDVLSEADNPLLYPVGLSDSEKSSKVHGALLDAVVPLIDSKYILTLDSDCFPVADGWLSDLVGMLEGGHGCAGILHPWAPPPAELDRKSIEYRVRYQHCWNMTHVACQLLESKTLRSLSVKFNGGDDTGLLVPAAVLEQGMTIGGFKPTRCPRPFKRSLDPEYNRYVSVVYGDKVYHHGGYTRESIFKDESVMEEQFGWARALVMETGHAEFLLYPENSRKYRFDMEETVAKEKMQRIFGLRAHRIERQQLDGAEDDYEYVSGKKRVTGA